MSKEAYYFSHDSNARHDPKILALRSDYNIQGYGIYWVVIEMLREQENFKLPKKEYIYNAIAMQVQCKDFANDNAKQFVLDCINKYELLEENETHFWSNSLLKRMDKKNELSEKRRQSARARWDKTNDTNDSQESINSNAMQKNANAMQSDARKGKEIKEIKVNETKKDINKIPFADTVFLTQEEYDKLVKDFGKTLIDDYIERLDEWQTNNPKKKKLDHNKTIRNWIKKHQQEKQQTQPITAQRKILKIGD
jgi:hypothetical protein